MAVRAVAMGPVLMQGRQVTAAAVTGCFSIKGYQAVHRWCVLAGVSLFVEAGRLVLQVQQQHFMKDMYLVSYHQADLQQANHLLTGQAFNRCAGLCKRLCCIHSFTQRPTAMRISKNINVVVFIKDLNECCHVKEKGYRWYSDVFWASKNKKSELKTVWKWVPVIRLQVHEMCQCFLM